MRGSDNLGLICSDNIVSCNSMAMIPIYFYILLSDVLIMKSNRTSAGSDGTCLSGTSVCLSTVLLIVSESLTALLATGAWHHSFRPFSGFRYFRYFWY